ncbi:MAG: bifunctional (p)ppGpp synthetase/guanosine-3',5'-bis(diphosphate) 3'-pyrophosphohydrolase [Candidatus Marinimicrobia bacterium]|nr:bifunctional (p)ppGpp synthetase/guanosine-3',5'-bis(diphosphate) 3'-pyrophosphohydrolase [Candidatus Neomarinimicrobiota bacterium]
MVVDTLKQIMPRRSRFPAKFRAIMANMNLKEESREDVEQFLWRAYCAAEQAHDGQLRKSGEPYFEHCYQTALLLSEWRMDPITIAAGFLHDVLEDTALTAQGLEEQFGPEVYQLVDGVTKLSGIKFRSHAERQAENFMKMLLSVARDIRVIIIKFADRLHNMRTIKYLPLIKQRRIAIETRDVYAPLAHRLGMARVKWDLEDLIFKVIEPEAFGELVKMVRDSRSERKKYIADFVRPIKKQLKEYHIQATVVGRPKHYYSIFGKMQRRQVNFEEIYDLLAVRIITERVDDCYAGLGIVHQLYTPIQERFNDFIATPKMNGYQSLHTTVVGPRGKVVEVQLRTVEMDETAEIGVAAHWRYKESDQAKLTHMDRQIRWLRELVEIAQNDKSTPEEFLELLKIDLFKDEIFIFTPRGDLIQLPAGSSPVDMAFEIHSEVGLQCVGARVNGKIVPLNSKLHNGDTVEIITSEHQSPGYAWLKFVQTSKAKSHIRRFMRRAQLDESIRLGEEILQKILRRLKMTAVHKAIRKNPGRSGYETVEQLYAALGRGDVTVRQVIVKFTPEQLPQEDALERKLSVAPGRRYRKSGQGVRVDGISDLMISLSKCCNPIPGDEIIGFVTRGRGITVHRVACSNLPIIDANHDRFVEVEWDVSKRRDFVVPLKIVAEDRKHFLKDLTESTSKLNTNIASVDMVVEDGIMTLHMSVEVDDIRKLERIQNRVRMIPGLIYMERI